MKLFNLERSGQLTLWVKKWKDKQIWWRKKIVLFSLPHYNALPTGNNEDYGNGSFAPSN